MSRLGTQRFFDNFEGGTSVWNSGGGLDTKASIYNSDTGTTSTIVSNHPTPRSGSNVLRMRATNGDQNSAYDFAAQTNNMRYGVGNLSTNSDMVVRFYFWLDKKIGFNYPGGEWGFHNFFQFKGVGSGFNNPLHSLNIGVVGGVTSGGNNIFNLVVNQSQWGAGSSFSVSRVAGTENLEIPYQQWVEVIIRCKLGDGDGIFQVWQDGVMIFNHRNAQTWRSAFNITRLDMSVNNYHRYVNGRNISNGSWDGLNYTDIYVDDFGIYNLNPEWDYDTDSSTNPEPPQPSQKLRGRFVIGE